MKRHYYSDTINTFLVRSENEILGELVNNNEFPTELTQREAWKQQIEILRPILSNVDGMIFFEYAIPRMGRRIDVVLIIKNVIFVLEFKVGQKEFLLSDVDQVWDYALDLKNFHETSHHQFVAPVLIATEAQNQFSTLALIADNDRLFVPIKTNFASLLSVFNAVFEIAVGDEIDTHNWVNGRYSPTPTIIEAATALYSEHSVEDISRSDASATNLKDTSSAVSQIIATSKANNEKAICFVTGVPGAGKTLVGLDIATKYLDASGGHQSVFLSGNGPLVAILTEALARDAVRRAVKKGERIRKGDARRNVKVFIQNVHHYRDEYLKDSTAPSDNVAIFDEAQRAWNLQQTADFMKRKKNHPNFGKSEPEFLISCLDRHTDWAVVVCLVGGGQEINRGEAGIGEWIDSINRSFHHWKIYLSDRLTDSEYAAGAAIERIERQENLLLNNDLHLGVSMRSFRAEKVSSLIKNILDLEIDAARNDLEAVREKYPIVLTRDLTAAKHWLRKKARGSERYGLVVSSNAQRLKPLAIDVKSPMNPVNWFLESKGDVRSSYYLEDVATEFHVQGLELDWSCVTWDADFRLTENDWSTHSFVGDKWHKVLKQDRKQYLKNAYRVLLTRARQGMVIVVPEGNSDDATRKNEYYDGTFEYLRKIGFETI